MGPPAVEIVENQNIRDLRAHDRAVAQDTLRILWHRKALIAASVITSLLIALIALMGMGPRYTSESLIQVNLNPDVGAKSQSTASVDATEVVDSTARIIRSRTTADALVAPLRLHHALLYKPQPPFSRSLSAVRVTLGLQQT